MSDMPNFFRTRRLALGLRQVDVATAIGLSRSAVCEVEKGRRPLSVVALQRLCDALQLDDHGRATAMQIMAGVPAAA